MGTDLFLKVGGNAVPLEVGGAVPAEFIRFKVEDGNLALVWAGNPPAAEFAINDNGCLEVRF